MAFVTPSTLPRIGLAFSTNPLCSRSPPQTMPAYSPLEIYGAKHVQFKGAKKADRRRPKKHRPSDINRKPPPFNPSPLMEEGLPSYLDVFTEEEADGQFPGTVVMDIPLIEKENAEKEAKQKEADALEAEAMERARKLRKERKIAAIQRRKEAHAAKKAARDAAMAAHLASLEAEAAEDAETEAATEEEGTEESASEAEETVEDVSPAAEA